MTSTLFILCNEISLFDNNCNYTVRISVSISVNYTLVKICRVYFDEELIINVQISGADLTKWFGLHIDYYCVLQ